MLSTRQIRQFVEHGYLIVPKIVSQQTVKRVAEKTLAEYPLLKESASKTETNSGGLMFPKWQEQTDVYSEIESAGLVRQLLGENIWWFSRVILYETQTEAVFPLGKVHIDRPPTSDPNRPWPSFSLNIGVAIQGGDQSNAGGCGVYPGSHRLLEQYFRKHPEQTLYSCLTGKYHPTTKRPLVQLPDVGMGPLVEICLNPGDVLFMHSMLAHTSMPNMQPKTRIAVTFALVHPKHKIVGNEYIRNQWSYWPEAVRRFAAEFE